MVEIEAFERSVVARNRSAVAFLELLADQCLEGCIGIKTVVPALEQRGSANCGIMCERFGRPTGKAACKGPIFQHFDL